MNQKYFLISTNKKNISTMRQYIINKTADYSKSTKLDRQYSLCSLMLIAYTLGPVYHG